jgi:hypothetical protein
MINYYYIEYYKDEYNSFQKLVSNKIFDDFIEYIIMIFESIDNMIKLIVLQYYNEL